MELIKYDKEILQAIVDGKEIEQLTNDGNFLNCPAYMALQVISSGHSEYLRIKPETVMINGVEVPKPIDKAPKWGEIMYLVMPTSTELTYCLGWTGSVEDMRFLSRGRLHPTEEAAIQHAKAEIAAVGGSYE